MLDRSEWRANFTGFYSQTQKLMVNFFGSSWNSSPLSFLSRWGLGLAVTPPSGGRWPGNPGPHLALHLLLRAVFLPRAPPFPARPPSGKAPSAVPRRRRVRSPQRLWREPGSSRPVPAGSGAPRRREAARHPTDAGAARPLRPTGLKSAL